MCVPKQNRFLYTVDIEKSMYNSIDDSYNRSLDSASTTQTLSFGPLWFEECAWVV